MVGVKVAVAVSSIAAVGVAGAGVAEGATGMLTAGVGVSTIVGVGGMLVDVSVGGGVAADEVSESPAACVIGTAWAPTGSGVAVGSGMLVGGDNGVQVAIGMGVSVAAGVGSGVLVGGGNGVQVAIGTGISVAVGVGGTGVGVSVSVGRGMGDGVHVGVGTGVSVAGGAQISSKGMTGGGSPSPQRQPSTLPAWTL